MKQGPPKTLTLVYSKRSGKIFYPQTDVDFETLKYIGVSVKFCAADFLPLLENYAAAKAVKIIRLDFDQLETKALENLERKWPGKFEHLGRGRFTLTCPRDDEHLEMVKSVRRSVQAFYLSHGQKTSYVIKRGARTVTVTFIAEVNPKVFVTQDEK